MNEKKTRNAKKKKKHFYAKTNDCNHCSSKICVMHANEFMKINFMDIQLLYDQCPAQQKYIDKELQFKNICSTEYFSNVNAKGL